MIPPNSTLVFETKELWDIFLTVRPQEHSREPGEAICLEDLVFRMLEDERLSQSERETLFRSQKIDSETDEQWNRLIMTIEMMREALVMNSEHLDFCFSELPAIPKNTRLRQLFDFYLGSALSRDWAYHVWSLIEHLKDGTLTNPCRNHIVFVPSLFPSPLFVETAKAFIYAKQVDRVEVKEIWELGEETPERAKTRRVICVQSNTVTILDRLACRLIHLKKRRESEQPLLLAFEGTEEERRYLSFRIASENHQQNSIWQRFPAKDPLSGEHDLVSLVRADQSRPLKERLKLSALLLEYGHLRHGRTRKELLGKLESLGVISTIQQDYLTSLVAPIIQAVHRRADVLLLPAIALPCFKNRAPLYFLGADFLKPKSSRGVLKESELEVLAKAGFPLPRAHEVQLRKKQMLQQIVSHASERRCLFTPLSKPELPHSGMTLSLSPPPRPSAPNIENIFTASLPPRRLSASQLESFARCPSYYFFANRMGLRAENLLDEKAYPLLFGQAVHLTLERRFALSPKPDATELEGVFRGALASLSPALTEEEPYHAILCETFHKLSGKIPQMETQLQALGGGATQIAAEVKFEFEQDGAILSGKIDRIDRLESGELLVLDYKTGSVDFCPDHIAQGIHFQALIYLLAVSRKYPQPCAGILFYDLKKGEARRGMILQDALPKEAKKAITRGHSLNRKSYDDLVAQGLSHLKQMAELIRQGNFDPTPSRQACEYCNFSTFCRHSALLEREAR